MILNKMQTEVLSSNKRIVVITAQAGSGITTALMLKLADEASKSKNNLAVYVRRTVPQVTSLIQSFLRQDKRARYSPQSEILTFKYKGNKVKIKMVAYENLDLDQYIPAIAIDMASHFGDLTSLINTSGRVFISDFVSHVEENDSWAYKSGLLKNVDGTPTWEPCVDNIKGFQIDNPGISPQYIAAVRSLPKEHYDNLMRVDFKKRGCSSELTN